jgi:N-acetylmuramoyl-L-alanine amidase
MMRFFRPVTLALVLATITTFGGLLQGCSTARVPVTPALSRDQFDPQAAQVPVFDTERQLLTSAYSLAHYGKFTYQMTDPQIIVVHYTAIPSLQDTLNFFKNPRLNREFRKDIASGGDVNVSAHYLVASNGDLFQLAPENVICRHTIGFNHTAIGIENVAADADQLTDGQAQATAGLISRLVVRHPSIRYLVGHHEYRDNNLPHYRLFIEHDASYRFTDKIDPGPLFMARVRQLLKEKYGMALAD